MKMSRIRVLLFVVISLLCSSVALAAVAEIPRTGQTICWDVSARDVVILQRNMR